jgi:hypothetical protein
VAEFRIAIVDDESEGVLVAEEGPQPGFTRVYDPTLSPREHDVAAGHRGEEVAVAILMPRGAFAFSTASYSYPTWTVPDWELSRGTYRVVVRVHGSSVEIERPFKLEYLDEDFAKFRLHET